MNADIDAGMYKKLSPEDVQGLLHMRRRAYAQKNRRKQEYEKMKDEDRKDAELYERD